MSPSKDILLQQETNNRRRRAILELRDEKKGKRLEITGITKETHNSLSEKKSNNRSSLRQKSSEISYSCNLVYI